MQADCALGYIPLPTGNSLCVPHSPGNDIRRLDPVDEFADGAKMQSADFAMFLYGVDGRPALDEVGTLDLAT